MEETKKRTMEARHQQIEWWSSRWFDCINYIVITSILYYAWDSSHNFVVIPLLSISGLLTGMRIFSFVEQIGLKLTAKNSIDARIFVWLALLAGFCWIAFIPVLISIIPK